MEQLQERIDELETYIDQLRDELDDKTNKIYELEDEIAWLEKNSICNLEDFKFRLQLNGMWSVELENEINNYIKFYNQEEI